MLIITGFINFTNSNFILTRTIFGGEGILLVSGRSPFNCIKQEAFIRKSKKEEALYIIKGNNVLILSIILKYDNMFIYISDLLDLKPVLDLIGDSKKGDEK